MCTACRLLFLIFKRYFAVVPRAKTPKSCSSLSNICSAQRLSCPQAATFHTSRENPNSTTPMVLAFILNLLAFHVSRRLADALPDCSPRNRQPTARQICASQFTKEEDQRVKEIATKNARGFLCGGGSFKQGLFQAALKSCRVMPWIVWNP